MSAGITRPLATGARLCGAFLGTLVLWTVWLALVVLLGFQIYVSTVNELPVPRFLLDSIQAHLAESGISVSFGRATFDPSGHVLLRDAKVRLASFAEPVVTATAIYVRLDPWAFLAHRFEAREVRVTGANLYVPAMLSASGGAEPLIEDLDGGFSIASRGDEFSVDYFNCRLGGLSISAHGTVNAGTIARTGPRTTSLPLAEFLSTNYLSLSREFTQAESQLTALDHAVLTAVLVPSDTRGAIVHAQIYADGFKLASPVAIQAGEIRASSRFPLLGKEALLASAVVTAESLRVGDKFGASDVRARIRGSLKIDNFTFDPRQVELTAGTISADGNFLAAPIARVGILPARKFQVDLTAGILGRPAWVGGTVDLGNRSTDVTFVASLSPRLLEPISERTGVDLRHFADLATPVDTTGSARFGPGWKFEAVHARVDTRAFVAYHVPFSEARATIDLDGTHLRVSDAYGASGANFVYGSYQQDFTNQDFRYLVWGRLRPLDISPWFGGDWWSDIFGNFSFPTQPPDANLEVKGRYSHVRRFLVYGYAEVKDVVLKGVPFDGLKTLIYVNEAGANGLSVDLAKGAGSAKGSFRLATEPTEGTWSGLDIEAEGALDPTPVATILPDEAAAAIRTFKFDQPPALSLHGHFDGPAAAGTPHKDFHLVMRDPASLRIHGVSFENATFRLDLTDQDIDVSDIEAGFAGGAMTGSAHVSGNDDHRQLRFKAALTGASLGQAAEAAQGYVVAGPTKASTALALFAKDKSGVRLDLNAAAAGRMGQLGSFAGEGSLQIQGAELGQIALLGGLSKVLKISELRFTQASSSIKIANGLLDFPDLTVRGANSQIRAKGTYAIDKRQLDFSATIYPFMESGSFLQIINALSAPISAVFRVRLTGSIDDPAWRLAYSPLNLLRIGETKPGAGTSGPLANPLPSN